MSLRQILVTAPAATLPYLTRAVEAEGAVEMRVLSTARPEGDALVLILAAEDNRQALLDRMQAVFGPENEGDWRITLLPVEATIPRIEDEKPERREIAATGLTREEIYDQVWKNARVDRNYIVFVVLSTVVAALGLLSDNVAVVVGAMVIAPLLGPNLALAVGIALGDGALMGRALRTNLAGVVVALGLSILIGLLATPAFTSQELMSRAEVGFDGMAIALASGAAAALSLVTGISSALVGVMVAVALLPPTAAVGMFIGFSRPDLALGAATLLAVNVVCVNLAAQGIMFTRGITPRTFYEKKSAARARIVSAAITLALLAALAGLVYWRLLHPTA
ncbi:TIGR00341 family protein [Maritimibacter sp. DP1N21-5]|uniref:TIGR00341 family protein n=1 Tax=Maritimibacter sp. DP1N21-5 TaxID=2836867 RepID=UPI001C44E3FB|nr:TIGR00341 family protein [Maritimibacter sp. DP1N21-5]MBV7410563.1 TIGR00341 family protein [Maritimibacter sp. DP1N21-5]